MKKKYVKRVLKNQYFLEESWMKTRLEDQNFSSLIQFRTIAKVKIRKNCPNVSKLSKYNFYVLSVADFTREFIFDDSAKLIAGPSDAVLLQPMETGFLYQNNELERDRFRYYVLIERNCYIEQMFSLPELRLIHMKEPQHMFDCLEQLIALVKNNYNPPPEKISVLLFECLSCLYRDAVIPYKPTDVYGSLVQRVSSCPQEFPSLKSLLDFFQVSRPKLTNIFRKHTGKLPMEFVIYSRLNNSRWQLSYTQMSIGEIALSNGYRSIAFFSKAFKQEYGVSPLAYRNSKRGKCP